MTIESRPYRDEDDLRQMLDLVGRAAVSIGPASNMHLGDVVWRRFMLDEAIVEPGRNVRLWESADELLGFAWFSPPRTIETQAKPGLDPVLLTSMLDWAESRYAEFESAAAERSPLIIDAYSDDRERIAVLEARGYRRHEGDFYILNHQPLDHDPPPAPRPAGATIREVAEGEIAGRVAIHREVWHPSRVTESAYRRLREAPGYRPNLDLIAVAPNGNLAAYCICWYDPISRSGEFEPVGTSAAYRGQGYGRAVVTEGLRRLRALGADSAIVFSCGTAEPANRLYARCGFRPIARTDRYERLTNRAIVDQR